MTAHARLSPSAAKIWMTCPAMPGMAAKVEQTTSVYAEEGTLAHGLAENCLVRECSAAEFAADQYKPGVIPDDMIAAVQVYLDYVRANTQEGDEFGYEQRLILNDHIWGTADFVRYRPETRHLLVADYKHGAGVFVSVEQNPQALTYAVMAAKKLGNRGVDKVTLAIIQPRCEMGGDGVREWEIDAVDLIDWEADLIAAMEATQAAEPKYVPGPHCRWCPAAGICPALAKAAQEVAKNDFAPALAYDPQQLSTALKSTTMVEAWVKSIWEFAFNEAQHGRCPPGFKLVQKRPTRKWASQEEAADFLKTYGMDDKDIYKMDLKTPPAIEKILGKKNKDVIADLIVSESSGVTLADENDKREAVRADASNDFAPVNGD